MFIIISPSKTQDFDCRNYSDFTVPIHYQKAGELVSLLKKMDKKELSKLMKLSDKLSQLNWQRFQNFCLPFDLTNARQALLVFKGDVFQGFDVDNYKKKDFSFAQNHLRILSGLYGILRPMDLIQAYRLEMGTKLANARGKNLYEFWNGTVTETLNREMNLTRHPERVLINLSSIEYFKVIKPKLFNGKILDIAFKEKTSQGFKIIGIHAKRARGLMADFIIMNRLTTPEPLKEFQGNGYGYRKEQSSESLWVFARG